VPHRGVCGVCGDGRWLFDPLCVPALATV
jgi:hypothetical protein